MSPGVRIHLTKQRRLLSVKKPSSDHLNRHTAAFIIQFIERLPSSLTYLLGRAYRSRQDTCEYGRCWSDNRKGNKDDEKNKEVTVWRLLFHLGARNPTRNGNPCPFKQIGPPHQQEEEGRKTPFPSLLFQ